MTCQSFSKILRYLYLIVYFPYLFKMKHIVETQRLEKVFSCMLIFQILWDADI